jgi:large subunit ribosomal protein L30
VSAAKSKVSRIRITWTRSAIHRQEKQKRIVAALGLHRLNESVIHDDSPTIRGMVTKISHLVKVESVEG